MNSQELAAEFLREKLEAQPWWRRIANTVTAAFGALVGIAWLAVSLGLDLPAPVMAGVMAVVSLGTVIGVRKTPNGVTERQIAELEDYVGRHRKEG
ncbi:hypothetical protein [Rhodococcus triatomae]|nr:hypothetical protein G419_25357 [Rhodococcus triatomae BKS 15-14]